MVEGSGTALRWSGIAAIVTALLAALPGFGDYFTMARHSDARGIATAHMGLNLATVALFVVAAACMGTVDFEGDLADAVAVFTQFGFDSVSALRTLRVLGKDDDALGPHLGEAAGHRQVFLALARAIHHLAGGKRREEGGMARQDTEVALDTRGHHFLGLGAHEHPRGGRELEEH